MPPFFDAHCHVDPDSPPEANTFPADSGNGRLLCGVDPADWPMVERFAAGWSGTLPAFGLHPWYAAEQPEDWAEVLRRALHAHPAAWVGEIGLDTLKTSRAPEATQEQAFETQLRLARELDRPVNLHCVKAYPKMLELLDRCYVADGPRTFLVHSFNGAHQDIEKFRQRGAYFSIGPLASRHDTPRIRARVALLPPERVVLESDAFLCPGVDAEAELAYTVRCLADLGRESETETWARVFDNSQRMCAND